jgi:hypothetical protein
MIVHLRGRAFEEGFTTLEAAVMDARQFFLDDDMLECVVGSMLRSRPEVAWATMTP